MKKTLYGLVALLAMLALPACQDDISSIGESLAPGEVSIEVDSLPTDLGGKSEWIPDFDSRTTTKLLGRLTVPEYGTLNCSFVTQLLSSTKMNVPDSITVADVDSIRILMTMSRGNLTGDSLTPQQLRLYRLPGQLPDTVTSGFDPRKYFGTPGELYGTRSYTLSNIAMKDSAYNKTATVSIPVMLPKEFAVDLFNKYRSNDPMFGWPSKFNEWFPGIYVEQNFGNGCVGNISKVQGFLYWHYMKHMAVSSDSTGVIYKDVLTRDSVCLLASQPEVVSSNNITYTPSATLTGLAAEGKTIVTSPGGFVTNIRLPADRLLARLSEQHKELTVVSGLSLTIPAKKIENDYGLAQAPTLLMVKRSERDSFFLDNKIPDNKTSFYANFNSTDQTYDFSALRGWILEMKEKEERGEALTEDDMEYTLLPVVVTTETVSTGWSEVTYVTRVTRYMGRPTMTELDTEKAIMKFVFSTQDIE